MKLQLQLRGLAGGANLRDWLRIQLERLQTFLPVSVAQVVLERERERAPAFRAHVHLAVPGPDIHADARDHTLEAVWLKVVRALRQQMERRRNRQLPRPRDRRQLPFTGHRGASASVAARG